MKTISHETIQLLRSTLTHSITASLDRTNHWIPGSPIHTYWKKVQTTQRNALAALNATDGIINCDHDWVQSEEGICLSTCLRCGIVLTPRERDELLIDNSQA